MSKLWQGTHMQGHSERRDSGHDTGNSPFLAGHDSVFLELASSAERAFSHDANTTLIKLRQLGETMAQDIVASRGFEMEECTTQRALLYRSDCALGGDPAVKELYNVAHSFEVLLEYIRSQQLVLLLKKQAWKGGISA